jgi:hypothetical protein
MKIDSQWGETVEEILGQVMTDIETRVEWPMTEIFPQKEVDKLLADLRATINRKLQELK